jgi:secondary thiamine-phosphate synthase enzyme
MPAHLKSSILGCQVTVPVEKGKLLLGTWQGIMLGEHRNHGGPRRIIATLQGAETSSI